MQHKKHIANSRTTQKIKIIVRTHYINVTHLITAQNNNRNTFKNNTITDSDFTDSTKYCYCVMVSKY